MRYGKGRDNRKLLYQLKMESKLPPEKQVAHRTQEQSAMKDNGPEFTGPSRHGF
jgi:hypothetical protein